MTINYYQNHAQAFFADTIGVDMSSLYAPFTAHLAPGVIRDGSHGIAA